MNRSIILELFWASSSDRWLDQWWHKCLQFLQGHARWLVLGLFGGVGLSWLENRPLMRKCLCKGGLGGHSTHEWLQRARGTSVCAWQVATLCDQSAWRPEWERLWGRRRRALHMRPLSLLQSLGSLKRDQILRATKRGAFWEVLVTPGKVELDPNLLQFPGRSEHTSLSLLSEIVHKLSQHSK